MVLSASPTTLPRASVWSRHSWPSRLALRRSSTSATTSSRSALAIGRRLPATERGRRVTIACKLVFFHGRSTLSFGVFGISGGRVCFPSHRVRLFLVVPAVKIILPLRVSSSAANQSTTSPWPSLPVHRAHHTSQTGPHAALALPVPHPGQPCLDRLRGSTAARALSAADHRRHNGRT